MLRITSIVLACLFFIAPAEARHRHHHGSHHPHHRHHAHAAKPGAAAVFGLFQSFSFTSRPEVRGQVRTARADQGEIVSHPAGCPRIAFCGCGAVQRLRAAWNVAVSHPRALWLAANWFKFPRTSPAPGMVAVRRHHVMVLEADMGGGVWRVYDANSGRHLTRVHARSIAGYAVVNPRASLI